MMRLKCIACEVLARAVYLCAASSPHIVDVELLEIGLHDHSATLRSQLQARLEEAAGQGYDAVLLAYGLCGQATAGLVAVQIPVVIPRAHDCITLFLGSRSRYQDQFERYPGTYWYTQDYIERRKDTSANLAMGSGNDTDLKAAYAGFVEKYGQENADYLMEVMGAWQKHYQRAVFIDLGVAEAGSIKERARSEAARRGWVFEPVAGDLILIRQLLRGDWEGDSGRDFLILQPGQQIEMASGDDVIGCIPVQTPTQGERK